jgi:hypothetical protein
MKKVVAMALALMAASSVHSQTPPAGESHKEASGAQGLEQLESQMRNAYAQMEAHRPKEVAATVSAQLETLSKPESAAQVAKYVRNLYLALIREGFSEDQALKLVSGLPLPNVSLIAY